MTSSHTKHSSRRYRVKRGDRAGMTVYDGRDGYGCANDDTRNTGVEHGAYSLNESGEPFFTLPKRDVELLTDEEDVCETCKGRGFYTIHAPEGDADDQPCPECKPTGVAP